MIRQSQQKLDSAVTKPKRSNHKKKSTGGLTMKHFKKTATWILALVLVLFYANLGLFAGGGRESEPDSTAKGSEQKPYHFITAYGPWDLSEGRIDIEKQPDDTYFQYVEKTVGTAPLTISWEWEGVTGYVQGLRLHMASGEIPHAMKIASQELAVELIENDVLIPLDDLLKSYAPDVLKGISEQELNLIRSQAPDNKIYYMPQIRDLPQIRAGFIRTDWLKRVGMDVPTTRNELVEVYKAFRDQDANGNGDPSDEIPVSGRLGMRWCDDLFAIHGVSMHEGHPRLSWDPQKKQMISHQVSLEMKEAIKFLRYLVEEGLMDQTFPIQKNQDWKAKINGNRVGHYYHLIGYIHSFSAFIEKDPKADWTYLPLVKVEGVPAQKHTFPRIGVDYPVFGITTAAKDPAKIMQWYNWCVSTEEGSKYISLGIPGVDWKMTGGKIEIINQQTPSYKYVADGRLAFSFDVLKISDLGETKSRILEKATEVGTTVYDDLGISTSVYEGLEDFMPNKAVVYRDYCSKMVLGSLPMSAWDEYVAAWHKRGGTEMLRRATEWYKKVNK